MDTSGGPVHPSEMIQQSGPIHSKSLPNSAVPVEKGSPVGSGLGNRFLNGASGPELIRWQARQGLIRKELALDFPDLTVPDLSSERTRMQTTFDEGFPR